MMSVFVGKWTMMRKRKGEWKKQGKNKRFSKDKGYEDQAGHNGCRVGVGTFLLCQQGGDSAG